MKNNYLPMSRQNNLVTQELDNEVLIYDLITSEAFCLNQTSAMVFHFCNGTNSIAKISDLMSKEFKTQIGEDFVWLALENLNKKNLLQNKESLPNQLAGLTRRDLIKKVGLASLVTLPVISSIVAPTAATAASGLRGFYNSCTSNAQCQSGNCTTGGYSVCCAPGANPFADSQSLCSNTGECLSLGNNCCTGPYQNQGPAPCGGAGVYCACL